MNTLTSATFSHPYRQAGVLGGFVIFVACLIHLPLHLNHDTAWLLQTSIRILHGDEIGVDVMDITPPMSMWLFAIAGYFIETFHTPAGLTLKLFFFLLSLAAIFGSATIAQKWENSELEFRNFCVVACVATYLLPGYDFAQREHFTALLTLPYVSSVILRAGSKKLTIPWNVVIGLSAAIGIGIKPYFVAIPILMELWLLFRTRRIRSNFRMETFSLLSALVIYLGCVLHFAPEYLNDVVPDAMNNYGGYKTPASSLIQKLGTYLLPFVFIGLVIVFCIRSAAKDPRIQGYLAAATGFLIAAIWQQKGWNYHLYPITFYLTLALLLPLLDRTYSQQVKLQYPISRYARWSMVFILGLQVSASVYTQLDDGYSQSGTTARVNALEDVILERQSLLGGQAVSVFAFNTSPRDIHPAVLNTGAVWAYKSGVLAYLPGAVNAMSARDKPGNYIGIIETAASYDRDMFETLLKSPPDVIIIKTGPYKTGILASDFEYLNYYSNNPSFQKLISQYEEQEPIMWFRIFTRRHKTFSFDN